jgi:hypothetical protein
MPDSVITRILSISVSQKCGSLTGAKEPPAKKSKKRLPKHLLLVIDQGQNKK